MAGRFVHSSPTMALVQRRLCRQELLKTPLASVTCFTNFFSTSECRELMCMRVTISAINTLVGEHDLNFSALNSTRRSCIRCGIISQPPAGR
jgi:hypothetical protein